MQKAWRELEFGDIGAIRAEVDRAQWHGAELGPTRPVGARAPQELARQSPLPAAHDQLDVGCGRAIGPRGRHGQRAGDRVNIPGALARAARLLSAPLLSFLLLLCVGWIRSERSLDLVARIEFRCTRARSPRPEEEHGQQREDRDRSKKREARERHGGEHTLPACRWSLSGLKSGSVEVGVVPRLQPLTRRCWDKSGECRSDVPKAVELGVRPRLQLGTSDNTRALLVPSDASRSPARCSSRDWVDPAGSRRRVR